MSKITSIEVQKKNQNRVNIYIDNEFALACDGELIYKYGLKKDMEVELNKLSQIINDDEFMKCKNSALRMVERTYKTEKEIKDKLLSKEYSEKAIDKVLEFLKEYNLLDDKKYTKMYVNDKIKNQGRNKIKYALIRKGISEDIIDQKISSLDSENEREVAYNLALKKYNILKKRENDKFKLSGKLFRFLIGKGYDYDCTNYVVKKIINMDDVME